MEGHVCNIQVLLRAAEFLERRERGECLFFCVTTVSLQGRKLVIVKTTKCTMKRQSVCRRDTTEGHDTPQFLGKPSRFLLEGCFRRAFGFDSVTYISVSSLYSKAPICSSLKLKPGGAGRSIRRMKKGGREKQRYELHSCFCTPWGLFYAFFVRWAREYFFMMVNRECVMAPKTPQTERPADDADDSSRVFLSSSSYSLVRICHSVCSTGAH